MIKSFKFLSIIASKNMELPISQQVIQNTMWEYRLVRIPHILISKLTNARNHHEQGTTDLNGYPTGYPAIVYTRNHHVMRNHRIIGYPYGLSTVTE
jgi:hypothetical protein